MSEFTDTVLFIIKAVPFGSVVSYGQVAALSGVPRAARQVGWVLNRSEGKDGIPWWRVINNEGRITIKGCEFNTPLLQKGMLENEGIGFVDDFVVDMKKYRFRPDRELMKTFELNDEYIERLISKYGI
jgi:methylated-DNA-protein-cysteine methyltransferase related protein